MQGRLNILEAIKEYFWTVLPYPPHGLYVAPSDFHLLAAPKDAIHGAMFE